MRYYVVSVLPEIFDSFLTTGLVGRGIERGLISVERISPREFASDRHRTVDDTPYGGGSGMVMMPGPLVDAMEAADAREAAHGGERPLRVMLTPQGARFDQAAARALASRPAITLIAGRYEGFDERARQRVDLELSLGDFVLMGGEVGAMVVIEATSRLLPGVLGNASSIVDESHASGWLEYPQYTRPAEYRGDGIPEVLLSGNHAKIAAWRRAESIRRTALRRPDLLDTSRLTGAEREIVEAAFGEKATSSDTALHGSERET